MYVDFCTPKHHTVDASELKAEYTQEHLPPLQPEGHDVPDYQQEC